MLRSPNDIFGVPCVLISGESTSVLLGNLCKEIMGAFFCFLGLFFGLNLLSSGFSFVFIRLPGTED